MEHLLLDMDLDVGLPELIGIIVVTAIIVWLIAYAVLRGRAKGTASFSGPREFSCDLPSGGTIVRNSVPIPGPTTAPVGLVPNDTVEVASTSQDSAVLLAQNNECSVLLHPGTKVKLIRETYNAVDVQVVELLFGVATFVSSAAITGNIASTATLRPMGPGRKFLSRARGFAIGAAGTVWSLQSAEGSPDVHVRVFEGSVEISYPGIGSASPPRLETLKKLKITEEAVPDVNTATNL